MIEAPEVVHRQVELADRKVFLVCVHRALEVRLDHAFERRRTQHIALLVEYERVHEHRLGDGGRLLDERTDHLADAAGAVEEQRQDDEVEQPPLAALGARVVDVADEALIGRPIVL